MFGPEYPKIQTLWKRDDRNVVSLGEFSVPEFEYLYDKEWRWTEKVDGTNIRLHWNGETVTVGGRTDNAQVPSPLVANLAPQLDAERWRAIFPDDVDDVTVYGEGYGAKIQSGGQYRQDQALIVFDVLVGRRWWLSDENVADVANKLGLDVVPPVGRFSLQVAWYKVTQPDLASQWTGARIEGLVGQPAVDLFNRKGERIMAKVKVKDWLDYQRKGGGSKSRDAERTSESAVAPSEKRRVKVTMTRTMWVDVPAEEAEWLLDRECDITTHADHVTRWLRIAGQGYEFLDSWLELEDGSEDWPRPYWAPDVVDGAGRERYLWSARHFLGQARYELSCGRYREGYCPDLDQLNGELARSEEALRLMALAVDHVDWPEVKTWQWMRWMVSHLRRHGLRFGAQR